MSKIYQKIKRQNGERFAQTLRNFHSGILEIPGIDFLLRHAGRDAEPLLPYLMKLLMKSLASNDDTPFPEAPQDPFELLKQAGYDAFYADTLEKQNSIARYFARGELLCTFNDCSRYERYHIVHAIKKNVDTIKRETFYGIEDRQDAYGTSVISIQMLKKGRFIKITNRYNHGIDNADNTFKSNPDNIIEGLSTALKNYFNVDFSVSQSALPEGYTLIGDQVFKYHKEFNNIFYGDQAWVRDDVIYEVDKCAGDVLFECFLFDNKTKTLEKIDSELKDTFASNFSRDYGGNPALTTRNGNLYLKGELLIGAEHSRIKTISLPAFTTMSDDCLSHVPTLTRFEAPELTVMRDGCLLESKALTYLSVPSLKSMGKRCLLHADNLTHFEAPALLEMEDDCFSNARALAHFETPVLVTMGDGCLLHVDNLTYFEAPMLRRMGGDCISNAGNLVSVRLPSLKSMGERCFNVVFSMQKFEAPVLTIMHDDCLFYAGALTHFTAPVLKKMESECLFHAYALKQFEAPALETVPNHLQYVCPRPRPMNKPQKLSLVYG